MNHTEPSRPEAGSRAGMAALMLSYFVGSQGISLLPFWMGTVIDGFSVGEQTAGALATMQLGILGGVSLLLSAMVHRVNRKRAIMLGLALSVAGNLVSILAFSNQSLGLLFASRAATGLGEGMVLALTTALAARTAAPIRTFALLNGSMAVLAGVVFLGSPALIGEFGASGFLGVMLFAALAAGALSRHLPDARSASVDARGAPVNWSFGLRPWLVLLQFGVCATVTGGVWAFAERVGANGVDLTLQTIGNVIAIAAFAAPLGPIIANLIGARFGHSIPVAIGIVLYVGVAFAFGYASSLPLFVAGAVGHGVVAVFLSTYLSAYLAHLDPSGRVAAASPAFNAAGNALGPSIMAISLTGGLGYRPLGWTALVLLGAVLAVLAPILRKSDRERRRSKSSTD